MSTLLQKILMLILALGAFTTFIAPSMSTAADLNIVVANEESEEEEDDEEGDDEEEEEEGEGERA